MIFQYRALKNNKIIKNQIDANNKQEVVDYLRNNNFFPIEVKPYQPVVSSFSKYLVNVSFNDIVNITRQLAIMLNACLTLVDCFDILKKQTTKPGLVKVLDSIDKDIRSGNSFSSALEKYPKLFSNLYISLIKSCEASGKLSDILLKLSDNMEKTREFQSKIKGALVYPALIIIAMAIVIFIMITFVLPKLLNLYKDFNVDLPITTKILMVVSNFCVNFWPLIIIGSFGLIVFLQSYLKTKQGKFLFDSFLLKLPILSNVIKISALVDSIRTLSILIGSGVYILDGLSIVIGATNNIIYQRAFASIYKQVEKGIGLGTAMANEGVFPPILIQMTTVG